MRRRSPKTALGSRCEPTPVVSNSHSTHRIVTGSHTSAARNMNSLVGGDPEIKVVATDLGHQRRSEERCLMRNNLLAGQEFAQAEGIGPRTRSSPTRRSIPKPHNSDTGPLPDSASTAWATTSGPEKRSAECKNHNRSPDACAMPWFIASYRPPSGSDCQYAKPGSHPDRYATTSSPLPPSITMCSMRPR